MECRSAVATAIDELSHQYVKTGSRGVNDKLKEKIANLAQIEPYNIVELKSEGDEIVSRLLYKYNDNLYVLYENNKYTILDSYDGTLPETTTRSETITNVPRPVESTTTNIVVTEKTTEATTEAKTESTTKLVVTTEIVTESKTESTTAEVVGGKGIVVKDEDGQLYVIGDNGNWDRVRYEESVVFKKGEVFYCDKDDKLYMMLDDVEMKPNGSDRIAPLFQGNEKSKYIVAVSGDILFKYDSNKAYEKGDLVMKDSSIYVITKKGKFSSSNTMKIK